MKANGKPPAQNAPGGNARKNVLVGAAADKEKEKKEKEEG